MNSPLYYGCLASFDASPPAHGTDLSALMTLGLNSRGVMIGTLQLDNDARGSVVQVLPLLSVLSFSRFFLYFNHSTFVSCFFLFSVDLFSRSKDATRTRGSWHRY